MLKARKANRVLKIPDEKKKTYIALGYTITDMDGNMIHEHVEPSEKLEQAEKEIQDLKEKLEEASKYAENADKKIEDLEKRRQHRLQKQRKLQRHPLRLRNKPQRFFPV